MNELLKIGDFVTSYESGYWQIIDIKQKIADFDYSNDKVNWKKGDLIGQYIVLKKVLTNKFKPKIDFSYVDSAWVKKVSDDVQEKINNLFEENIKFKEKYDNTEVILPPTIKNCWVKLNNEQAKELENIIKNLSSDFTIDEFWNQAKNYKNFITNYPSDYLLNFLTFPWNVDENGNMHYYSCELKKLK